MACGAGGWPTTTSILCLSWLTQDSELSSWPSWLGPVVRTVLWRTKGLQFLSLITFLNHVIARPSSDLTIEPQDGYTRRGAWEPRVIRQTGQGTRAGVCADRLSCHVNPSRPSTEAFRGCVGFGPHRLLPLSPGRRCYRRCDPLCGEQTGCCPRPCPGRRAGRT